MSRTGSRCFVYRAAIAITVASLVPGVGAAQARVGGGGLVSWPVQWPAAVDAAGNAAEPIATISILAPSSAGVTITGAYLETPITTGIALDAPGAPVDLDRFAQMQRAASHLSAPSSRLRGLPLSRVYVTSRFGMRLNPILGGRRWHRGIDLAAPTGTPVSASGGGTVRTANWNGGYGLFVEIDHGSGVRSRYGHMSRLNVYSGQRIQGGEVIGYVGSTGNSTGPHLHYEITEEGRALNPLNY